MKLLITALSTLFILISNYAANAETLPIGCFSGNMFARKHYDFNRDLAYEDKTVHKQFCISLTQQGSYKIRSSNGTVYVTAYSNSGIFRGLANMVVDVVGDKCGYATPYIEISRSKNNSVNVVTTTRFPGCVDADGEYGSTVVEYYGILSKN